MFDEGEGVDNFFSNSWEFSKIELKSKRSIMKVGNMALEGGGDQTP